MDTKIKLNLGYWKLNISGFTNVPHKDKENGIVISLNVEMNKI